MPRKRPTASNVGPPTLICIDGGLPSGDAPVLTRAEAQTLLRSAPLAHAQLRAHLKGLPDPPVRGL